MLLCIVKEADIRQTTVNRKLHTKLFSQLFSSLSCFLLKSLSTKPLVHIAKGHVSFQLEIVRYSESHMHLAVCMDMYFEILNQHIPTPLLTNFAAAIIICIRSCIYSTTMT